MLILFDIDGTLVDAGGAGVAALQDAAVEVFGGAGPPLDLAGSTDGAILRGFFEYFGRQYDPAVEGGFYQSYLSRISENLQNPNHGGRLLGGVKTLLASLRKEGHFLGLLTGNIERGAMLKVAHYGIADYFQFGAYGDDHWNRNKLGPIALERAEKSTGMRFSQDKILVIGDTPKDVACAHAFGVKCVAVATGNFNEEELVACGADRTVPNLEGFSL
ncbi:HAD hydrolase-like protein [Akkermansiaceae bacterium]|jgi:phosphoglycolate phosphatase|nr:HAD hydrolase-like protein [Verrucomicrobiota bacterium]MDA7508072.1 HAD hydrolase-like protein [Akkermansiaceae bacterium]MDB4659931.1 HAD hydrolase-like protein [bacterium]MBT6167600.1 HAD hydrolase-like protein [Verrucomicrobiota bacterium]MBT6398615.1 HAD hydrolase-like protein [Verrucomicrobiota bacterium]